jgi:hypothetical protein
VPAGAAHTKSVRLDSHTVTLGIARQEAAARPEVVRGTKPGPAR